MPVLEVTAISDLLAETMRRRGVSERQLAAYMGVSPAGLNRWMKGTGTPDPRYCWKIAEIAHVPVEEVMRAAGHLPESEERAVEPEIVPELRDGLSRLTPGEQRRLVRAVELVLELREEKGGYDAGPPSPPSAPPPQGGPSR